MGAWTNKVVNASQGILRVDYPFERGNAWYFVKPKRGMKEKFLELMQKPDPIDLDEYCEVLARGWGEPDAETVTQYSS